eukprot:jgi/Mesvir1/22242/Mv25479-RA.4
MESPAATQEKPSPRGKRKAKKKSATSELTRATISSLSQAAEDLQDRLKWKGEELATAQSELAVQKARNEELTARMAEMKSLYQQVQVVADEAVSREQLAGYRLAVMELELARIHESNLLFHPDEVEEENSRLRSQLQQLYEINQAQADDRARTVGELENQMATLRNQLEAEFRTRLRDAQGRVRQEFHDEMSQRTRAKLAQNAELWHRLASIDADAARVDSRAKELEARNAKLRTNAEVSNAIRAGQAKELNALRRQLAAAEERCREVEHELEAERQARRAEAEHGLRGDQPLGGVQILSVLHHMDRQLAHVQRKCDRWQARARDLESQLLLAQRTAAQAWEEQTAREAAYFSRDATIGIWNSSVAAAAAEAAAMTAEAVATAQPGRDPGDTSTGMPSTVDSSDRSDSDKEEEEDEDEEERKGEGSGSGQSPPVPTPPAPRNEPRMVIPRLPLAHQVQPTPPYSQRMPSPAVPHRVAVQSAGYATERGPRAATAYASMSARGRTYGGRNNGAGGLQGSSFSGGGDSWPRARAQELASPLVTAREMMSHKQVHHAGVGGIFTGGEVHGGQATSGNTASPHRRSTLALLQGGSSLSGASTDSSGRPSSGRSDATALKAREARLKRLTRGTWVEPLHNARPFGV